MNLNRPRILLPILLGEVSPISGLMPSHKLHRVLPCRHERTQRRVALYRGVHSISFDITHTEPEQLYRAISKELLDRGHVKPGDELILTLGELSGVSGGTNTMKLLRVEG